MRLDFPILIEGISPLSISSQSLLRPMFRSRSASVSLKSSCSTIHFLSRTPFRVLTRPLSVTIIQSNERPSRPYIGKIGKLEGQVPRPRIDNYWQQRIKEETEQNIGLGSSKLATQLEQEAARLGRDDPPGEKSVRNYMKGHRAAPEHERRLYRKVYWPESFGKPELPWESAPAVLEAMRACEDRREDRPTVRTAMWFWRLALAEPGIPAPSGRRDWARTLLGWARNLAACEASGLDGANETWRNMERRLLHPGVVPPEPFHVVATIDALEEEGAFSPAVAEQLRESKLRRIQKEEGTEP